MQLRAYRLVLYLHFFDTLSSYRDDFIHSPDEIQKAADKASEMKRAVMDSASGGRNK